MCSGSDWHHSCSLYSWGENKLSSHPDTKYFTQWTSLWYEDSNKWHVTNCSVGVFIVKYIFLKILRYNALKCTYVCPWCYCLVRKAVYCDFNGKWWVEPSIQKILFVSWKSGGQWNAIIFLCVFLCIFWHKIPIWIVLYSTLFRDVQMKILTSSESWLILNL